MKILSTSHKAEGCPNCGSSNTHLIWCDERFWCKACWPESLAKEANTYYCAGCNGITSPGPLCHDCTLIAQERQRCAGIVRKELDDWAPIYDSEDAGSVMKRIIKEITDGE
jgi:hypothetical protein